MSTLVTNGNWNIATGKLKQKIARLADDERQYFGGNEDELTGRIQKRASQSRGKFKHLQVEAEACHGCHC